MPLQEVARFPNELSQTGGTHQYCGPTYPSLLLATNSAHLRLGGCTPRPGQEVVVVGVPAALATSLALLHSLVSLACHPETTHTQRMHLCRALSACVTPLINVLRGVECPPLLREKVFLAISNALQVVTDFVPSASGGEEGSFPFATIPSKFFTAIESELKDVYCSESTCSTQAKDAVGKLLPQSGNVFQGGSKKFSTYFQTLLAFFLSMDSYQTKHGRDLVVTESSSSGNVLKVASNPSQESIMNLLGSSSLSSQELTGLSESGISQESAADSLPMAELWRLRSLSSFSQSESSKPPESSSESCSSFQQVVSEEVQLPDESRAEKVEEWLVCAKRVSQMLRSVVVGSSAVVTDGLSDCLPASLPATPYDCLLVLTKFCPSADPEQVERDVVKVCRQHGGLYNLHIASQPRKARPSDDSEKPLSEEDGALPAREVVGVVLELCSAEKRPGVSSSLLSWDSLQGRTRTLSVSQVSSTLSCQDDADANSLLQEYLMNLLVSEEMALTEGALQALIDIFTPVPARPVTKVHVPSLLQLFLESLGENAVSSLWEKAINEVLSQEIFLKWATMLCETSPLSVWSALFAVGYDLHFCR